MHLSHKNKTIATLLAAVLGSLGVHRFYLYGKNDKWAWLHLLFSPLPVYAAFLYFYGKTDQLTWAQLLLFSLPVLAGFIEALVIGLTPDDKWDTRHNPQSGRQSASGWPLALLLVLTTAFGAIAIIATLARTFDLLYTGGAYG